MSSAGGPQPHSLALLSLKPINPRAEQVVAHPSNAHLVSRLEDGTLALDVGHVRSISGHNTLATLGRNGDIFVDGSSISRIHCSFEIDAETHIVMFYDRSNTQTTRVFGKDATPFEHGRLRRVVVEEGLNTMIGMGGVGRNLVQFKLRWHAKQPEEMLKKVKEREGSHLKENPRLARTVDEADTTAPSRMETRIHTAGSRQPKLRWKQMGESLGAGQFGIVVKGLDLDSGKIMAVKLMSRSPGGGYEWSNLKREVEILAKISHVGELLPHLTINDKADIVQKHVVDYIFSQGWEEGKAEIFMGLKDGTLHSLVTGGPPSTISAFAEPVFHHMLQALDFLATEGIIHRDLKPENILYLLRQGHYHFQLSDFGLSNRQAIAVSCTGTAYYMAPEIYHSPAKQTPKVDVWSLFVTMLWTLDVAGFRGLLDTLDSYPAVQAAITSAAESKNVLQIRNMAEKDPRKRPSAAQLLVKHFDGKGLTTPRNRVQPSDFIIPVPPSDVTTPVVKAPPPVTKPSLPPWLESCGPSPKRLVRMGANPFGVRKLRPHLR